MKGEERKARLVVEESGKNGLTVRFEGSLERYSAFIATAITNYRDAVAESFGTDAKEKVNESLKEFIDLEGTDDELREFPAKVYSKLKDVVSDYGAMLARLLLGLLEDIKSDIDDDVETEADAEND